MVEVGRDLWRSCSLTPALKEDDLEPFAQKHVQKASEYLRGGFSSVIMSRIKLLYSY